MAATSLSRSRLSGQLVRTGGSRNGYRCRNRRWFKALIPGVRVTIRNTGTNISHTVTSNQEGCFTVPELAAGPYELTAVAAGFEGYRQTDIVLQTGEMLTIPIRMAIGSVNETVKVTADAAVINTEDGKIKGQVIVYEEIQDMPLNGRDFTDLAITVPGVTTNAQGGAGLRSINGARADSTNFMVDGFSDRNSRGAAADFPPQPRRTPRVQDGDQRFSAEYGKMAGGIVNMTIQSGTNDYHGALFEYFRNNFFDARNFFSPTNLDLHQNQFGGMIGGPSICRITRARPDFLHGERRELSHYLGRERTRRGTDRGRKAGNFTGDVSNTGAKITLKNPFSGFRASQET